MVVMMLKIVMTGNWGCHCCQYHRVIPPINSGVVDSDLEVHLAIMHREIPINKSNIKCEP